MQKYKYGITMSSTSEPSAPVMFSGDFQQSLKEASRIGFDAVEIHVGDPAEIPYKKIISICEQENISVCAMATGQSFVEQGLSFIDDDPDIRELAVARFKDCIDLGSHLDSKIIVGLMRGRIDDFGKYDTYYMRLKAALDVLINYAEKKGVALVLEAINRFQTNYINSLYETIKLIDNFKEASIGLHIDTFHMNIEDKDFIKTIEDCGKYIQYVHYSDNNRLIPGAGNIDFLSITKCLTNIKYNGVITIESLPFPSAVEAAENGLKYLKTIEELLILENKMEYKNEILT